MLFTSLALIPISITFMFHYFDLNLFPYVQLEVEVKKLYASIINMGLIWGDANSLPSFSKEWKIIVWETRFFQEFKSNDGIHISKTWEQQLGGNETLKTMLYE